KPADASGRECQLLILQGLKAAQCAIFAQEMYRKNPVQTHVVRIGYQIAAVERHESRIMNPGYDPHLLPISVEPLDSAYSSHELLGVGNDHDNASFVRTIGISGRYSQAYYP